MKCRIPTGSYCAFRSPVEHRDISDPDTGGGYTVKLYDRPSRETVVLRPDKDAAGYASIELHPSDYDSLVVAELVEVLDL